MRQNVNLLSAELAPPVEWLSFNELLGVVGGFAVVLAVASGAQWGYGAYTSAELRDLQAAVAAAGQKNEALRRARSDDPQVRALVSDIAALTAAKREKERLLAMVGDGVAAQPKGFAGYFEALARDHVDGLWINHVAIDAESRSVDLGGQATDAAQVPVWLAQLRNSPAFAHSVFSGLALTEQKVEAGIGFTIKGKP